MSQELGQRLNSCCTLPRRELDELRRINSKPLGACALTTSTSTAVIHEPFRIGHVPSCLIGFLLLMAMFWPSGHGNITSG